VSMEGVGTSLVPVLVRKMSAREACADRRD
jgi:hypothetical protein